MSQRRSAPIEDRTLSSPSLGSVLSDELPADGVDAGLETETADDALEREILRSLTDQRRPDFRFARRIHVFAVQCAQNEPRAGDGREQQGAQMTLVRAAAHDGAQIHAGLIMVEG